MTSAHESYSTKKCLNETMRLLFERSSCRSFVDKKIPEDVLNLVLEAGVHAPTAGNLQPYSIIRIEDPKAKQKLAAMCEQSFIGKTPVLLLFCLDLHRNQRWATLEVAPYTATSSFRHFWVSFQDTLICAQNICTAADSMGLGSVYIGAVIDFPAGIQKMLQLPEAVFPVVLLCMGYPTKRPKPRNKLGVKTVVHPERYHELEDQELLDAFNEKYRTENAHSQKLPTSPERMETIMNVCRRTHGEEFAKKCAQRIQNKGYINMAQYYFGLHYKADVMPEGNDNYLKLMEKSGLKWFKKYEPPFTANETQESDRTEKPVANTKRR
jgi:nitroreductase